MQNTLLTAALLYREKYGLSPIPVGHDKKALVNWGGFQNQQPTSEQIVAWWTKHPNANIGIVCGRKSNVAALDMDTYKPEYDEGRIIELVPDSLFAPTFKTGSGGRQMLFSMPDVELRSINGLLPAVDFKAEGGYSIFPPSRNQSGPYEWLVKLEEAPLPPLPPALLSYINNNSIIYKSRSQQNEIKASSDSRFYTQGRRDEDLFHAANLMVKGGGELPFIEKTLEMLSLGCSPPFSLSDAPVKVKSAMQRAERRERNIAAEVREWVLTSNGFFLTSDCFRELGLTSRDFQKAATLEFLKLLKAGIIERAGKKRGSYRTVDQTVDTLDFLAAPSDEFDIDLPLNLSSHAVINPKNIIIFAGSKDAGKTAIALDLVKRNMGRFPILYMTSEMGGTELRKRLEAHEDMTLERWKEGMQAVYRAHSWADLVTPEKKLFVIDYVEPPEERLYEVGTILRGIHEKLKDGVAVCFIQKKYQELTGRGGQFTLDKARLYVGLDPGRPNLAKIVSCKSFRGVNPRQMTLGYKLHQGWKIEPQGYWKEAERT